MLNGARSLCVRNKTEEAFASAGSTPPKDFNKIPGYSKLLESYGFNNPVSQFNFWTATGGLIGGSIYVFTRFQYAKLVHQAFFLQKVRLLLVGLWHCQADD